MGTFLNLVGLDFFPQLTNIVKFKKYTMVYKNIYNANKLKCQNYIQQDKK